MHKQGMIAHTYSPSTQEVEEGGTEIKDHPWLPSKFGSQPGLLKTLSQKDKWMILAPSHVLTQAS